MGDIKKNSFFKIERIVSPYYRCHPAGFVMIKNEVLSKIARFYIRIMLYRNKKFDDDLSLKHRPKLNEIAMSLNQLPSYLNKSIGSEIITIEQRTEFFELIGLLSEEVSGIDRSILNDLISAYYKIHRYLVIPFVYTGFDFTKKNIYIFFAPKKIRLLVLMLHIF